jgi:predicted Rossmann-fold nucleotide-binding protein
MEAASRGAAGCGGRVIGIGCTVIKSPCNPYVGETIMTDNLFDRMRGLVERGDAYIVMPGLTGTLAELAVVWEQLSLL